MKISSKQALATLAGIILFAVLPIVAFAQSGGTQSNTSNGGIQTNPPGTIGLQNPLSGSGITTVGGLVSNFLQILTYLAIIAGILMIIYVGLQLVLARGNSDKIKEHKEQMLWLVVGLAIVIGARVLVTIVINTLSATGTVNSNIINSAHNAINQTSP